jgi:hypothetical protein
MTTTKPAPAPSLADDLHQAGALLAPLCGKSGRSIPLVLCLLGAIWLAVERLRQAEQTSASADKWQSSCAATVAKGRELGIDARPGELMPDYRARLVAELKARGPA